MKKKIFETLIGLSAISIVLGITYLMHLVTKGYEFNFLNFVFVVSGIFVLIIANRTGNMIMKVENEKL
jgi:heme/copper-type cytochrome/quinol oxidase subunit 4